MLGAGIATVACCVLRIARQPMRSAHAALQCFNAKSGDKYDEVTLDKPASWRPQPKASDAYYKSLDTVPQPKGE
jgi:hypothetical protein